MVSVFFIAFTGLMFVPAVIAARKLVSPKLAVSWFVVAAAATYLWTSTTGDDDYDVRGLADPAEFGVFAVNSPEVASELTNVRLTVLDTDVLLEVNAAPGSSPLFIVVAEVPPEYGCIEYGAFYGSTAYACVAPTAIQFPNAVSYSWSGAALEAGGVSITTDDTEKIGELDVTAVPVDVTFETYWSFDGPRIFNRPFLGVAAVDQSAVTFPAEAQTRADEKWTAAVEYRFPRGTALLSIARDLSLIILGGAVSLVLIPQLQARASEPLPTRARTRRPKRLPTYAGRLRGDDRVKHPMGPAHRQPPSA